MPESVPTRPATEGDIDLAYRLLLGRSADAAGMTHYLDRIKSGLTINDLLAELTRSDEFTKKAGTPNPAALTLPDVFAERHEASLITPADVMAQYSIEDLIETADEYYRRVPDSTPLLIKPFFFLNETPEILSNLGALLDGLRLGKAMTVLDFGGGSGWLSKILSQLNCYPICCDVSTAALAMAARMFEDMPPVGHFVPPRYLRFDGRTLDLPDASVDRIICFDSFHHVPNPERLIHEFGRVLRTGGVAGFSEPGPRHSQSAQSQYEMRHHRVLENDINIAEISRWAAEAGFTNVRMQVLAKGQLAPDEAAALLAPAPDEAARHTMMRSVREAMATHSIFYLDKGDAVLDSRSHEGLAASIELLSPAPLTADADGNVHVRLALSNTGRAIWIHEAPEIFGIVRVGTHLSDASGVLLNLDFTRHGLPKSVQPGERLELDFTLRVPPGEHRLAFDLLAEGVTWFENAGSKTVDVQVRN